MHVCSQILLILIITTTNGENPIKVDRTKNSKECDERKYTGAYKLKPMTSRTPTINIASTEVKIDVYPEKANVIFAKRRRYTRYCYNGGSIDSNTGCYTNIYNENPNPTKTREWSKKEKCPVGYQCKPFGICWGSDSARCLDNRTIEKDVGPKELKYVGEDWKKFAYHTCVQSWECNINKREVRMSYKKQGNTIIPYFSNHEGQPISANDTLYYSGYTDYEDFIYTLDERILKERTYYSQAKCYSASIKDIICVIQGIAGLENEAIQIDSRDLMGIRENIVLSVRGNLEVLDGDKIRLLSPTGEKSNPEGDKMILQKSASLESLAETMWNTKAIQMQSLYNIIAIENSLSKLSDLFTKMLNRLSKHDPYLVGETLGKDLKTKWVNDKIFTIAPCYHVNQENDLSNCKGNHLYMEGVYIEDKNQSNCYSIDSSELKNMTIMNLTNIDLTLLKEPPLHEASRDTDSWDWLIKYKADLYNKFHGSTDTSTISEMSAFLKGLNEWNPWEIIKNFFFSASCFVAWISFFLVICRR